MSDRPRPAPLPPLARQTTAICVALILVSVPVMLLCSGFAVSVTAFGVMLAAGCVLGALICRYCSKSETAAVPSINGTPLRPIKLVEHDRTSNTAPIKGRSR